MSHSEAKGIVLPQEVTLIAADIPYDPACKSRAARSGEMKINGIATRPMGRDHRQRRGSTRMFKIGPTREMRLK